MIVCEFYWPVICGWNVREESENSRGQNYFLKWHQVLWGGWSDAIRFLMILRSFKIFTALFDLRKILATASSQEKVPEGLENEQNQREQKQRNVMTLVSFGKLRFARLWTAILAGRSRKISRFIPCFYLCAQFFFFFTAAFCILEQLSLFDRPLWDEWHFSVVKIEGNLRVFSTPLNIEWF